MKQKIKRTRNKKATQLFGDLYPVVRNKLIPLIERWQQEYGNESAIEILDKVSIDDIVIFVKDKSCS